MQRKNNALDEENPTHSLSVPDALHADVGSDIILAEPKALVGFAGKRVIQQTANAAFPDHFQTAEFLLEHGFLDAIVERENMKETITLLCAQHRKAGRTA